MELINIFLTDIRVLDANPVWMEVAKVLSVSVLWIGGLAAFVHFKEKKNKPAL